jgi:hypothetical protein
LRGSEVNADFALFCFFLILGTGQNFAVFSPFLRLSLKLCKLITGFHSGSFVSRW